MNCPLCSSPAKLFFSLQERSYYECDSCKGIFVPEEYHLDPIAEKERYQTHNNDVNDPRYQNFVAPIVNEVKKNYNPRVHTGLDFGAGTGPVISKLLNDLKYQVIAYDPYFLPFPEVLRRKYDFIVCCEVMEHFKYPAQEFKLLRSLLNPGGKLFCMTHIYDYGISFGEWYYKNDPTHIFIYQKETIGYIKDDFNFQEAIVEDRLITFCA